MFGSILGILGSIPAIIKLVSQFIGLIGEIRRSFQKDPVEEMAKDAEKQKVAQQNADQKDDTTGAFGG